MSRNEVTGDIITVGAETNNKAYEDGWDRIFGKKKELVFHFTTCEECPPDVVCKSPFCKNLEKMATLVVPPTEGYHWTMHNGSTLYFTMGEGESREVVFKDNPTLVYEQPIKFTEGDTYKLNVDKDSY